MILPKPVVAVAAEEELEKTEGARVGRDERVGIVLALALLDGNELFVRKAEGIGVNVTLGVPVKAALLLDVAEKEPAAKKVRVGKELELADKVGKELGLAVDVAVAEAVDVDKLVRVDVLLFVLVAVSVEKTVTVLIEQSEAPRPDENPTGHGVQAMALAFEYVPEAQGIGLVVPWGQKNPGGQITGAPEEQ